MFGSGVPKREGGGGYTNSSEAGSPLGRDPWDVGGGGGWVNPFRPTKRREK